MRFLSSASANLRHPMSNLDDLIFIFMISFRSLCLIAPSFDASTFYTKPFLGYALLAKTLLDLSLDPSLLIVFSVDSAKNARTFYTLDELMSPFSPYCAFLRLASMNLISFTVIAPAEYRGV